MHTKLVHKIIIFQNNRNVTCPKIDFRDSCLQKNNANNINKVNCMKL